MHCFIAPWVDEKSHASRRVLMDFKTAAVRVLAVSFLLFANSILVAAQPESIYQIPAGTRIRLKMDVELSSKVASVGDTFTTAVAKPITIRDTIVLPAGTVIEGRVTSVSAAASGGSNGRLDVVFESLRLFKTTPRKIDGELVQKLEYRSSSLTNALTIVGGTVAGVVIGAFTKSSSGALFGAGIGAGAGTGVALLRKGKDVRIQRDEEFEIVLKKDVVLPVLDY
jgi:hypothetical protein